MTTSTLPARTAQLDGPKARYKQGKALRGAVPLASHAEVPPPDTRDALALLEGQSAARVPDLVPIRYGRMSVSPWTFYRGAARVMAEDLAKTPSSGITVQVCGDAHLANFGLFGSAERRLMFDMNDFDETFPGPWEWDVKRLVASLVVAARERGWRRKDRRRLTLATVARYRQSMQVFAGMGELAVWYASVDAEALMRRASAEVTVAGQDALKRAFAKAHTKDSMQALGRLTHAVNGHLEITADPPLIVPLRDLMTFDAHEDLQARFHELIRQYRRTLQTDRRVLLEHYTFVDMARKVVGVGSVGTRCWIVLLVGRDQSDPLFLQIKEAGRSVIAESLGKSSRTSEGQRVVTGQRLMQAASDIFLGWQTTTGIDDVKRDFYFRQLRDWKFSFPLETMRLDGMQAYAGVCAWSLARAHARSGDRALIAGYMGSGSTFDNAIADFAETYADRNEADYDRLIWATASGRITAQGGI